MSGEGAESEPAAPRAAYGCLGALLLVLGLFVAFAVADVSAFLIAAPGPLAQNLSPSTIYAARSDAWWREPFIVIAPILYLPIALTFEWARSPRAFVAALKRIKPASVWIGPAVFLAGLAALGSTADSGLIWFLVVGLAALVGGALAALFLFGWATRAGIPQFAPMLLMSAVGGAVFGVSSAKPAATVRCEAGASVKFKSGAAESCAAILVFSKREAYLVRRPDDAVFVAPAADIDLASLRAAAGPREIWFEELKILD